jgi:hypothetical protein
MGRSRDCDGLLYWGFVCRKEKETEPLGKREAGSEGAQTVHFGWLSLLLDDFSSIWMLPHQVGSSRGKRYCTGRVQT